MAEQVYTIQEIPEGHVTTPRGFRAAGVACGIKASGAKDLALLVSETPAVAAGVFTTNQIHAYNIDRNRRLLAERSRVRAVLVNSGNANVCTGQQEVEATEEMARLAAEALGIAEREVLTSSTGIIGVPLPVEKIRAAMPSLVARLSPEGGLEAAEAILTTDTRPKHRAVRVEVGESLFHVGGIAKGAGMIHPHLATMLAYITTDAEVRPLLLRQWIQEIADETFNMVTVDGDTSTSDTFLILSNGASGVNIEEERKPEAQALREALLHVAQYLAREIARDGEGATKLVVVEVEGAPSKEVAKQLARTVSGSLLVRTALYGNDPNWGRIVAAAGRAGVSLEPSRLEIRLAGFPVFRGGEPQPFDREQVRSALAQPEVVITLILNSGHHRATAWSCDLTERYVRINAELTT